jgi:hypothetical protein
MISPLEKAMGERKKKTRKKRAKNGAITKAKVWSVFSRYIRLRDADLSGHVICPTCGNVIHWSEAHAGHALPGRKFDVLFDENIVYAQCSIDNIWKNGCYPEYAIFLIKKFGLEWYDARVQRAGRVHKLGKADLQEIFDHYTEEVERLKLEKGL